MRSHEKVATLSQLNRKCLFHSQVLEIASIYPVTTIKANVLAIPNQQCTAIRKKKSSACVCVYINERFPISSRSPQCVLNDMKKIPPPNFVFLTMKLSMNHRAIQSLNIQALPSLYISCLFINKHQSAV